MPPDAFDKLCAWVIISPSDPKCRVRMAAKQPRLGLDHPTVVPTNFTPSPEANADADDERDDE